MLRPTRVGARFALAAAALAAALCVGLAAEPHAQAAGKAKVRPPTLLWKSYPLVQRSRTRGGVHKTAAQTREATGPATGDSPNVDHLLLLTALLATLLAAGTVVFLRAPSTVRVGSAHGRARPRASRPVRRPQPRRPRTEPKTPTLPPPPAPEVATENAARPEIPPEEAPAAEPPPDDLQRVLDDLLEALRPQPAQGRQEDETPELELRDLIVRKYGAPASSRHHIEREIDEALARIEKRRAAAQARARAAVRTSLARSEIKLSRGLVKSQLCVVMSGAEEAFAVSEPFRLRDTDEPGPHAQRALSSLLAALSRSGWMVVAHGSAWYDHTLELFPPHAGARQLHESPDVPPDVVYRPIPNEDEAEDGAA
jgi:hypothetical protein